MPGKCSMPDCPHQAVETVTHPATGQKLDLCVAHKESYDANIIGVGRVPGKKDKKEKKDEKEE
jgi:hypothetical protein